MQEVQRRLQSRHAPDRSPAATPHPAMQLSKRKRAARSHVRPGAGTAAADGDQGTVLLAVEEVLASERRHADAARAAADKASALQQEVRLLEVK